MFAKDFRDEARCAKSCTSASQFEGRACPATGAEAGPVSVKVVALMVDGFMALLKVAVTAALAQAPLAPLGGATEITAGAVTPGLLPLLSESPHPVAKMRSNSAAYQIF
jgi:hypothetical protein